MIRASVLRAIVSLALFLSVTAAAVAQRGPTPAPTPSGYRTPPEPIARTLAVPPTPRVSLGPDRRTFAILGRREAPAIADLARPTLALAGYRIDPQSNGPSEARTQWYASLAFQDVESGDVRRTPLPAGARFLSPVWSRDGRRLAFALDTGQGFELWIADRDGAPPRRMSGIRLNMAQGGSFGWADGDRELTALVVPADRGPPPAAPLAPSGPRIEETAGRTAPVRTFQDLLQTDHDEALFRHYFRAALVRIAVETGAVTPIAPPDIYTRASGSPDGGYMILTRLKEPFSRTVPAGRFAQETTIIDRAGKVVHRVVERGVVDDLKPDFDSVVTGPRAIEWRADEPATLAWTEATDGGDPAAAAEVRDRLYMLPSPFTDRPVLLAEFAHRFDDVIWGRSDFALVTSRWYKTRTERRFVIDPSKPGSQRFIGERNYQNRYDAPGSPLVRLDARGRSVIHFTPGGEAYYQYGNGATPAGDFPFLDRVAVADATSTRVWRAEAPYFERLVSLLDDGAERMITLRESATEPPNYFLRSRSAATLRPLTTFPDRAPEFARVTKRLVTYTRADGVTLSGTLYLPPGYDQARDGPLPVLMWAYPTEFTDAKVAGQVVDEANRFVRPGGSSHLFMLTQGYAVFDDPKMPIIGQSGAEPNDTYVEQLTGSAKAAVDELVRLGIADRRCIAVGGHSYGAFMTANLLAHTDLFAAGIARSGAYNRTLTPFGFQAEQRTYWQRIETYTTMSPFTHAQKIKEPLLLIHGERDDNAGTFPIQSERFYAALRGNGATSRLVMLPHEAHGYRARESVGHTLFEMHAWLERHVRPKCAKGT